MKPLILQSDFGLADGAVSAMYGVAEGVCDSLRVYDLTHDIPQYDIWEASYRLIQTVQYWPEGSVFVSVVDPGVGSDRRSIVAKTSGGHYIVTPDNGTLTHIKRMSGIVEARVIDETLFRLPNSAESYTFHGRQESKNARVAKAYVDMEFTTQAECDRMLEALCAHFRELMEGEPRFDEYGSEGPVRAWDPPELLRSRSITSARRSVFISQFPCRIFLEVRGNG